MRPAMTIRHMMTALAACVLALGLAGCTTCSRNDSETGQAAQGQSPKAKRGRGKKPRQPKADRPETRKVKVGEETRRYMFARSRVTNPKTPAPALVVLHDNGEGAAAVTGRRDLMGGASKLGYLVAAPIASSEGWGPGLCNTESAKEPAAAVATKAKASSPKGAAPAKDAKARKGADAQQAAKDADAKADAAPPGSDVDYIKAVVADLGGIGADPKRIYLVAVGGAAAFAERLVAELPGQFAGVALFAPEDCKQKDLAAPSSPVPALVVTGEPAAPADGGTAAPAAPPKAASLPALDYWLKADACDPKPQPGKSEGDVDEQRYACKAGALVRVHLATSAKPVPRKLGNKWTMRYLAEFFQANTH
jgi:poly(3-hydroxybutyrate) depolymerase